MENKIINRLNPEIERLQKTLVPLVQEMYKNGEICFSSVFYGADEDGNAWHPKEPMAGKHLWEFYDEDPDWVVGTSKKIADDYQKVILRFLELEESQEILPLGKRKENLLEGYRKWSDVLVKKNLISREFADGLLEEYGKAARSDEFFALAHGNIIGDHIFADEEKNLYLMGMRIAYYPAKGCYDFLRALDWLILKAGKDEEKFEKITSWMKQYLQGYDQKKIELIFALRCIGILGWDALHRGDHGRGDFEKKKEILLKFIGRKFGSEG